MYLYANMQMNSLTLSIQCIYQIIFVPHHNLTNIERNQPNISDQLQAHIDDGQYPIAQLFIHH